MIVTPWRIASRVLGCGVPEVGPGVLSSGDRWLGMIPACRCGYCIDLLAGAWTGPADGPNVRRPRTSNSSSCATKSPSCAAPTRDRAWTGRTGPCSPPSSCGCPERCVAIAWSRRARSCVGIAASCADDGPTPTGLDGHRSTTSSRRWWCGWRGRTRAGDTCDCRVSCSNSATTWAPRRFVGSFGATGSRPLHCGTPTPAGGSSCAHRPPVCSRWTSSTSTAQ